MYIYTAHKLKNRHIFRVLSWLSKCFRRSHRYINLVLLKTAVHKEFPKINGLIF